MSPALVTVLLLPSVVGAHWESGLPTGRSHMIAVTSSPIAGLEAGMPRNSAYARAIELDLRERWSESLAAYRTARKEFEQMLVRRPQWAPAIKGWLAKAEFQIEQSRRLQQQSYYYRPRWRSQSIVSPHTYYYRGVAKHNKWLGIRAFTGRAPRKLFDGAVRDYHKALARQSSYTLARLALAGLYHEVGERELGRREFAKLQQPTPTWMAVNVAYYHTAAGNFDKALELLEQAVAYSRSNLRYIMSSNDFDRLRSLARFRKLFGEKSP